MLTPPLEERTSAAKNPLRVTWVTRSFLDYRVPVFHALDELLENQLTVIYSDRWTPVRVQDKLKEKLGSRAIMLTGERNIGGAWTTDKMANKVISIPIQPGLFREISATRPDVLIGDGFFQWTTWSLFFRFFRKIPLVMAYERTFHTERHAQWYRSWYRRLVLRLIDAMCCSGRLCSEYSQYLGMPASRITTGHMVADTEGLRGQYRKISMEKRRSIRQEQGWNGLVFLFVGQIIERKGIQQLLEAWTRFEKDHPADAVLCMIGTGSNEDDLKRDISRIGLKNVQLLGSVDYDKIASFYAAADVFVMPTLEDNWSLVVPEAMACGLPILTSKYNGCWPEFVQENRNGWVCDSLDPEDIYRCLTLFMKNRQRLKTMGEASIEMVSGHTTEHAARAILDACEVAYSAVHSK